MVWAVIENLGYRQLTLVWRIRGVVSYMRGKKSWGKMNRKGFNPVDGHDGTIAEFPAPPAPVEREPVGVAAFSSAGPS